MGRGHGGMRLRPGGEARQIVHDGGDRRRDRHGTLPRPCTA